jgi:hypothetical protein
MRVGERERTRERFGEKEVFLKAKRRSCKGENIKEEPVTAVNHAFEFEIAKRRLN